MVHSVTSAPMSLAEDTDLRMRRYLITMGIRIVCFILAIVFQGWLRWAFVAGATILPSGPSNFDFDLEGPLLDPPVPSPSGELPRNP